MPRRVADYDPAFASGNMLSSIGAMIMGISVLPFLFNVVMSLEEGPARRSESLARIRPRMDGLVAAAHPQLRRRRPTSTATRTATASGPFPQPVEG